MRWFVGTNSGISEESFLIMAVIFGVLALGVLVSGVVDSTRAAAASMQPGQIRKFGRFIFRSAQFLGGIIVASWAANTVGSVDSPFFPGFLLVLSVAIAVSTRVALLALGLRERAPLLAFATTLAITLFFFSWAPFAIVSALEAPTWSYWISLSSSGLASFGALSIIGELLGKQARSGPDHKRKMDLTELYPLSSIGFVLLGGGPAGQLAVTAILDALGISGPWHVILFWTAALLNIALVSLGLMALIASRADLVSPRVVKQIEEVEKKRSSIAWIRFTNANRYQEATFYFDLVIEKRKTFFTLRIEPKFAPAGFLDAARSLGFDTTDLDELLSVAVPWKSLNNPDALTGLVRMIVPRRTDLFVLVGYTPKATGSNAFFFAPSLLEEEWEYESPKQQRLRAKQRKSLEPSFGGAVSRGGSALAGGATGYSVTTVAWKESREADADSSEESNSFDL